MIELSRKSHFMKILMKVINRFGNYYLYQPTFFFQRQRLRQKNERRIQREFFERQRKMGKVSKVQAEHDDKKNGVNTLSQDLLFLQPWFGNESKGYIYL